MDTMQVLNNKALHNDEFSKMSDKILLHKKMKLESDESVLACKDHIKQALKYPPKSPKQYEFDMEITNFFVLGDLPFARVDSKEYKILMTYLIPKANQKHLIKFSKKQSSTTA